MWFVLFSCFCCSLPYVLFWRGVLGCGSVVPCGAAWAVPPCFVFGGPYCGLLWCAVLVFPRCFGPWFVPLSFQPCLVPGVPSCFSLPFCVGEGCFCPCLLLAVVLWCRGLSLVSLSGRVARCAVVCCGLAWCPTPLCCVIWCHVSVWCPAIAPCCPFCSAGGACSFLLLFGVPLQNPEKWFWVFEKKNSESKLYTTQHTWVHQNDYHFTDLRVSCRPPWRHRPEHCRVVIFTTTCCRTGA